MCVCVRGGGGGWRTCVLECACVCACMRVWECGVCVVERRPREGWVAEREWIAILLFAVFHEGFSTGTDEDILLINVGNAGGSQPSSGSSSSDPIKAKRPALVCLIMPTRARVYSALACM
jgi:hypothetical protein